MNTETSLETEVLNNSNNLELKFVALSVEKAIKIVAVDDIVYLESSGRYTTLYFNNNSNITVCKNLGHFEKLFGKNHFIRIHHSFLINIAYLTKIVKDGSGQYCELNFASDILPISNRRFASVKKYLHY
jgi:two-component system LytT family response regulator